MINNGDNKLVGNTAQITHENVTAVINGDMSSYHVCDNHDILETKKMRSLKRKTMDDKSTVIREVDTCDHVYS